MSETQVRKGRGCFFYGCLTLVVLFLVCAVGLFFGVRYVVKRFVDQYTSASPMPVPQVEGTPEEVKSVQERFNTFIRALTQNQPTEPLALSERDINLLLSHSTELQKLRNHLYVDIEGNTLKGTLSLPLDQFGWSMLKGRYLNGVAELKASLENGVLVVTLDALEVNGRRVPDDVMTQIRRQNFAGDLYKDRENAEIIRKLRTIDVEDDQVLIKPQEKAP